MEAVVDGISREIVERSVVASQLNGANSMDIQHIHEKVHLTGRYLPMQIGVAVPPYMFRSSHPLPSLLIFQLRHATTTEASLALADHDPASSMKSRKWKENIRFMLIAPGRFTYEQLAFHAKSFARLYSNRLFISTIHFPTVLALDHST